MKFLFSSEKSFFLIFSSAFFYLTILASIVEPMSHFLAKKYVDNRMNLNSEGNSKLDSLQQFIASLPYTTIEINKYCPKEIDAETELMKAEFTLEDTVFRYLYRIKGYTQEEISDIGKLKNELSKSLSEDYYKNSNFLTMNKNHVNMSFDYYDKNRVFLFSILFKASYTN